MTGTCTRKTTDTEFADTAEVNALGSRVGVELETLVEWHRGAVRVYYELARLELHPPGLLHLHNREEWRRSCRMKSTDTYGVYEVRAL